MEIKIPKRIADAYRTRCPFSRPMKNWNFFIKHCSFPPSARSLAGENVHPNLVSPIIPHRIADFKRLPFGITAFSGKLNGYARWGQINCYKVKKGVFFLKKRRGFVFWVEWRKMKYFAGQIHIYPHKKWLSWPLKPAFFQRIFVLRGKMTKFFLRGRNLRGSSVPFAFIFTCAVQSAPFRFSISRFLLPPRIPLIFSIRLL